jgi:hypothetical protein
MLGNYADYMPAPLPRLGQPVLHVRAWHSERFHVLRVRFFDTQDIDTLGAAYTHETASRVYHYLLETIV